MDREAGFMAVFQRIFVSIPFRMLVDTYLERFLENRVRPEIGLDAETLETIEMAEFSRVADLFRERGLAVTVHGPFVDLSPGSPDPDIRTITRKRFDQMARAVALFRPETVVCHTGFDFRKYRDISEAWLDRCVPEMARLAGRIESAGARLMIENVYERTPAEMTPLFARLPDTVGFCLDSGHAVVFSETSPDGWIDVLGRRIGQLHVHNNNGKADDHLPPGSGVIDFVSIFNRLKLELGSPPTVTFEPHKEPDLMPGAEFLAGTLPW